MMKLLLCVWAAAMASVGSATNTTLSNTLGSHMVLQQAPATANVWGFGTPGVVVTTTVSGSTKLTTTIDGNGVWRQSLPPTKASNTAVSITIISSDGAHIILDDVLFGEVFLCGGQSNMQYTPLSMAGMNNATAEIASANNFPTIRMFTVGQGTRGGSPLMQLKTIEGNWTVSSSAVVGATAWKTFSAVCFLFGRNVHDALGGAVPIGLVSNNWGGTSVQSWSSTEQLAACNATQGTDLYNPMIHPYTVGPMRFNGAIWYQGESNVGQAEYYACQFPAMISGWRKDLGNPSMWFGFIQVAGFNYRGKSLAAGDLRQAELAALKLPNVGLSTAIDTGDFVNIHPPDKQNPARRLSDSALAMIYGKGAGSIFPIYKTSTVEYFSGSVAVSVSFEGSTGVGLTTVAPAAATASTTLGKPGSVPRNQCVTINPAFKATAADCGYPAIYGQDGSVLNATASISGDSIVLKAAAPAGFKAVASSYGRASWPTTVFFGANGLPVIPWYEPIGSSGVTFELLRGKIDAKPATFAGKPSDF